MTFLENRGIDVEINGCIMNTAVSFKSIPYDNVDNPKQDEDCLL